MRIWQDLTASLAVIWALWSGGLIKPREMKTNLCLMCAVGIDLHWLEIPAIHSNLESKENNTKKKIIK